MSNNGHNIEKANFDAFINAVGSEIQQAQVRLIVAANAQMLFHYWKMGNYILYHQQLHGWGSKTIKQLAKAIRFNYPEKKGYSERNLTYMCQFAKAYPLRALQSFIETDAKLIAPSVEKIADEVRYLNDAQFTQEPLTQVQSADNKEFIIAQEPLAQIHNVAQTVSDIYRMEIKDIESVFMASPVARTNWASHVIMLYLLEMGNGFAFVARQKHFQVGNSDFFADLILYSIPLHAYIVIELKATPFKPEYAGQLNFYINVVDDKLRGEHDNKTIGLLLCRGKDEVVAQYALSGYDQPIGISDYQLSKAIPENLKSALPSIEEVEEELASFLDKDKNP